jgi:hypothetical protein
MAIWVKKNASDFTEVKKLWVKKDSLNWAQVKRAWVKKTNSTWTMFWPQSGPAPEEDLYLEVSRNTYPATGSNFPELTLFNYHWEPTTPLTLRYKWQVGPTSSGPWTNLTGYDSFVTYTPGNPSSNNYNTLSFTPDLEEYVGGRVYFNFIMRATGESTSEYSVVSESVNLEAPYWYQSATFFGTASPGYTFTWDAGVGRFQDSSYNIGYMTTIYRSNDNGVTKEYLVGTSTTPEYSYVDNTQYVYTPLEADIGYTYYASTYAIHGDSDGPFENALSSTTITGIKKVLGPPGPFSITSFIKGPISGNLVNGSRTLTLSYTASTDATQYQYKIERSVDNVTWYSFADYFYQVAATDPTTNITITDSSTQSYRYYRATMRATNETNLYTTSTNTNVPATGSPPGAPTINSATVYFGTVTLNYTETTNFGSGSGIYAHDYAYKLSTDTNYSQWIYTGSYGGSLPISGLEAGRTYSFKIRSYNDDNVVGPESNSITVTIPAEPGALTNTVAKTWSSGSVTVAFTTGNNTTGVYYFATNGPYVGSSQFVKQIDGLFSNISPNTSYVREINNFPTTYDQYDILLYAQNETVFGDNVGTFSEVATGIYPDGSDKALASLPIFSDRTGSSFTANYALFNTTSVNIDVRLNGSSIAGYPQTLSQSAGPNGASFSHTPSNTLSDGTLYTFSVTPYYQSPIAPLMLDYGVQKSATVSTIYKFSMGKTLHVGTNGYIGLTDASSLVALPSTGIVLSVYGGDFVQAQTAGADGSGLLHYWSNSDTYVVRWSGYRYGYLNNGNYRVTYEAKFYTNQSYCDIKYLHVGSSVWSSGDPTSRPGIYANGNLISNGIPGPYFLSTGNIYRIYYNGSMPTASISFTDVEQADMISAGGVSGGSSDDGYTSLSTTTNQYTFPTISFGLATLTSSSISIPLSGTYYSYDYTIRSGSYSGTIVAFGNNQTGSTISASGLSSGTTYYLTASPKNFWLQYGNNTQNNYTTTSNLTAPTITSVTPGVSGGPVSVSFTGGSGPYYQAFWWGVATAPTGITSADASGSSSPLTDNTGPTGTSTVYMYVRSTSSLGETSAGPSTLASAWSSGYAFNMISKLSTPTNVSASDNRSDGIQVSWTNVSNAATYGVWWGGVPSYDSSPDFGGPNNNGGKTITSSPFLDNVVTTGTTRNYYVQAFPAIGSTTYVKSDWSTGDSGTRVAATVAPTITSGSISPTSGTAGSTTFTASASGVAGTPTPTLSYQWQYFSSSSFSYANVPGATSSTYAPPANFNTFYPNYGFYCLITATNTAGSATVRPSATLNSPVVVTVPGVPTGVGLTGSGSVSWSSVSGATSYEIQFYTARSSSGTRAAGPYTVTGIAGTSYQLGSTGSTQYAYPDNYARVRVRARNSAGVSSYSSWVPSSSTYT